MIFYYTVCSHNFVILCTSSILQHHYLGYTFPILLHNKVEAIQHWWFVFWGGS